MYFIFELINKWNYIGVAGRYEKMNNYHYIQEEKICSTNFIDILLDFIVAIFLTFKVLNYSLVNIFKVSESGFLSIVFMVTAGLFAVACAYKLIKRQSKLSSLGTLVIIVVLGLYVIYANRSNVAITEIVIYFLIPIIIGFRENFYFKRILEIVLLISLLPLCCFTAMFNVGWYGGINMDISYAFLPVIAAAFVHFAFYYKECRYKIIFIVLYAVNLMYFSQIVMFGERGTLLCLLVCIVLLLNIKYKDNQVIYKRMSFKIIVAVLILGLFILFGDSILKLLVNTFNINSYAINKFIEMLEKNDISNGRFAIYRDAVDSFSYSPLWGRGIGSFEFFTGEEYPHNLLLQLLHDGGLILFGLNLYVLFRGSRLILSVKEREYIAVWIYLLSISVVYLMFSQNIWFLPAYWIFIGMLSSISSVKMRI